MECLYGSLLDTIYSLTLEKITSRPCRGPLPLEGHHPPRSQTCEHPGFGEVHLHCVLRLVTQPKPAANSHEAVRLWHARLHHARVHPIDDVFSLGIIIWQLTAKQPQTFPGSAKSARGLRPDESLATVESRLLTALYKVCWAEDPEARPSMAQVEKILQQERLTKSARRVLSKEPRLAACFET